MDSIRSSIICVHYVSVFTTRSVCLMQYTHENPHACTIVCTYTYKRIYMYIQCTYIYIHVHVQYSVLHKHRLVPRWSNNWLITTYTITTATTGHTFQSFTQPLQRNPSWRVVKQPLLGQRTGRGSNVVVQSSVTLSLQFTITSVLQVPGTVLLIASWFHGDNSYHITNYIAKVVNKKWV